MQSNEEDIELLSPIAMGTDEIIEEVDVSSLIPMQSNEERGSRINLRPPIRQERERQEHKYELRRREDFMNYVDGNVSDVSDLADSSDEDNDNDNEVHEDMDTSDGSSVSEEEEGGLPRKYVYRWRKQDTPIRDNTFTGQFSPPPDDVLTPLQYFRQFFTDETLELIVHQTNLYSTQKDISKPVNTSKDEILTFIGLRMKMGIVKLPSPRMFWSQSLRYAPRADIMPRNRFQTLSQNLHFIDNLSLPKINSLRSDQLLRIFVTSSERLKMESISLLTNK